MNKEIRICSRHDDYKVPLIWTFAFNYAEFWCPYCGANYGMLGAGRVTENSEELEARHGKYKEISKAFLNAKGTQICAYTTWNGEKIDPNDLPQEEKDRLKEIISEWKYEIKIEELELNPPK